MIQERTKEIALFFERNELLNDIEGYAYVEGDVMQTADEASEHGKHQTQDIAQEGNIDLVTRHLDLAVAKCREALYPYTKSEATTGRHRDKLKDTSEYCITLLVPEDFSESTAVYLEQLIHNLLVYYALWGWLSITKPQSADVWLARYEDCVEQAKKSLTYRTGRIRRFQSPF